MKSYKPKDRSKEARRWRKQNPDIFLNAIWAHRAVVNVEHLDKVSGHYRIYTESGLVDFWIATLRWMDPFHTRRCRGDGLESLLMELERRSP